MNRVAIYRVSMELIAQGLRAVNALPSDAVCETAERRDLLLRVTSARLPVVLMGEPTPRRVAVAGQATGEPEAPP